jgi:hypothetical protein
VDFFADLNGENGSEYGSTVWAALESSDRYVVVLTQSSALELIRLLLNCQSHRIIIIIDHSCIKQKPTPPQHSPLSPPT